MKNKPCECQFCKESKRIQSIWKKLPPEDAKWLKDFYNMHINMAEDLSVKECVLNGSWPSSVEQLTEALKKAKEIRK